MRFKLLETINTLFARRLRKDLPKPTSLETLTAVPSKYVLTESEEKYNTAVIILGVSGSGKTTVAKYLEERHDLYAFHPYRKVKDFYEDHYGLSPGYLDTKEGKEYIPPGMTITMQEMMVAEYHFRREVDPLYTTRAIFDSLSTRLLYDWDNFSVQGLRNIEEVEEIEKVFADWNFDFVLVELQGRNARESSDEKYDSIKQKLLNSKYNRNPGEIITIINEETTSLEDLYKQVDEKVINPA